MGLARIPRLVQRPRQTRAPAQKDGHIKKRAETVVSTLGDASARKNLGCDSSSGGLKDSCSLGKLDMDALGRGRSIALDEEFLAHGFGSISGRRRGSANARGQFGRDLGDLLFRRLLHSREAGESKDAFTRNAGAGGFDQIDAAVAVGVEALQNVGGADDFRRRQAKVDVLDLDARPRRARDWLGARRLRGVVLVAIDGIFVAGVVAELGLLRFGVYRSRSDVGDGKAGVVILGFNGKSLLPGG